MHKTEIRNFAVQARNRLLADIRYRAGLLGITAQGIREKLPQSLPDLELYDIGTAEPSAVTGVAIQQRRKLVRRLQEREKAAGWEAAFSSLIEETAWTWFNRLTAVRFMEVNDYLPGRVRVLSSESGKLEPDLVTSPFSSDLKFTPEEEAEVDRLKDENRLDELFRLLFLKQCNALQSCLPGLFEPGGDETELLLRLSFTDRDGVVYRLVHEIPEEDFNVAQGGQVEIIGWLYQYYNTEPKDAVFGRPSGTKIQKEDIPAATQLFTPDWIVRYMVENSLGRLWADGHPDTGLKKNWKYYLEEAEQEPEVDAQLEGIRREHAGLNPEDLTCIDPCMGSGHILVYLFDVLMQIYESMGWPRRDAVRSILENNLYGLDVDDRAAQLAYFAVMMKAMEYDRGILRRGITPHVYAVPESNALDRQTLDMVCEGDPALRTALDTIAAELQDAKEYGSILHTTPQDWESIYSRLDELYDGVALSRSAATGLLQIVRAAELLSRQYQIVVTNPPYMGSSGMDAKLSAYVKKHYPDSKSDLFSVFIERCGTFTVKNGYQAMITQHAWMFLSSYERLRGKLQHRDIVNMAHLGARAFEEIGGEVVQTTAFVMRNADAAGYQGVYCRLIEPTSQDGKEQMFLAGENRYTAKQENFEKIPGSPVAYWVSDAAILPYQTEITLLGDIAAPCAGLATGDNNTFQRFWHEVSTDNIGFDVNDIAETLERAEKWYPCNSGSEFRKWSTANEIVVNWKNNGEEVRKLRNSSGRLAARPQNTDKYFKEGLTWNKLSSSRFAVRYKAPGFIFDDTSRSAFVDDSTLLFYIIGVLCSSVTDLYLKFLNPSMSFTNGDLIRIPVRFERKFYESVTRQVKENIFLSKNDWDMFETSWDFQRHPMLCGDSTVSAAWQQWKSDCETRFQTLKSNEEELNRIFIDIYGLQEELTPEVSEKDVTVRRFFETKEDIPESMKNSSYALTKQDAVKSLLSYAVGCMLGRYSLDYDGLAYAGGTWDDSRYSTFLPDKDNCIPITDEEYFEDDIVGRFCDWLKAVYGPETLEENLDFIAEALGTRGSTSREKIRTYFLKNFYKDHCRTYQKRPIYWLFDSGGQNGFRALVYMHRWNADTIGNVCAEYLQRMQQVYDSEAARMQAIVNAGTSSREAAAAAARKEKLERQQRECRSYYDKLNHLAQARPDIDLDDGVKVNYRKVQTDTNGEFYEVLAKL